MAKTPSTPLKNAIAELPVFDGGETLVKPELFRDIAYSDRTGDAV